MSKALTLVVALPPSGQPKHTFCQDFLQIKNVFFFLSWSCDSVSTFISCFYLFQTLRFEEPFLGPSHRQPQAEQRRQQTPHASGTGHNRLENQVCLVL